MKRRPKIACLLRLVLGIGLAMLVGWSTLSANTFPLKEESSEGELRYAQKLFLAGLLDEALQVVLPLYDCLSEKGQLTTSEGIRVRQQISRIYKRKRQEDRSIAILLPLIEDAERLGYFAEAVHAKLTLASIYHGTRQLEKCRAELDECAALIRREALDSLVARYAIRVGAFHSHQRNLDSVNYYANLALQYAERLDQKWERAYAYTILNDAFPDTTYLYYIDNLKRFAAYQREVENYIELSAAFMVMGIYYLGNNRIAEAKSLNDSILIYLNAREQSGGYLLHPLYNAHRQRMNIFEAMELPDSALYHAKIAWEYENRFKAMENLANIREVEARYADDAKAAKIAKQEALLKQERKQQMMLLLVLILFASLALLLYRFNQRLGRANRSLANQSTALEQTNKKLADSLEHQELLRGELHHRVKNNLQIIISMLGLQELNTSHQETKNSIQAMSERVYSIATVHELLYPDRGSETVDFYSYVRQLCDYATGLWPHGRKPNFRLDIPAISLNLDTLVPLGILLSELLTNTRKYFGATKRSPYIHISLQVRSDRLCLEYRDNGPGFPKASMQGRSGGLGKYLLAGMSRQLKGTYETCNDHGAVTRIYFQLKNMQLSQQDVADFA